MSPLRRVAAVLLLTLWVPALLHCRLEAAGLRFAAECCETPSTQTPAPSHGCADDSCEVAEGEFTAPAALALPAPTPVAPGGVPDLAPLSLSPASLRPPIEILGTAATAPPEVRVSWHFVHRTAPPSRAPSLIA